MRLTNRQGSAILRPQPHSFLAEVMRPIFRVCSMQSQKDMSTRNLSLPGDQHIGRKAPDREFFAELLLHATSDLIQKTGSRQLAAAALGIRVRDLLRIQLGNPDVLLNGLMFGPILYPNAMKAEYHLLKFRDFLSAFPDIVRVVTGPSGDKVDVLEPEKDGYPPPVMSKGITLSKAPGPYQSTDRVTLRQPITDFNTSPSATVEVTGNGPSMDSVPLVSVSSGLLVVESVSIVQTLHSVFGGKPDSKSLPQWDGPARYVRSKFPAATVWRRLYFMTLEPSQVETTEGFQLYLKNIGYQVIPLKFSFGDEHGLGDEKLAARARVNATAVVRGLSALTTQAPAHVAVVTHSPDVIKALEKLAADKTRVASVTLIAFPELLSDSLGQLKDRGIQVVDLEYDAGAFKVELPRTRSLIPPDEYDPSADFAM